MDAQHNNVYLIAQGFATWNGPLGQQPLHAHSGWYDIVILKLNTNCEYQWHPFYGSSDDDGVGSITADTSGNVYATGRSFSGWNGPSGTAPLHSHSGGGFDIVVLKLFADGTYQWHTFYGSTGTDYGSGIAMDGSGNVYVSGFSGSTWKGPNNEDPKNAHSGDSDIVVLKLNSNGAYQWHTFYGSGNDDFGNGIAVDGSGDVYVTGWSWATWDGDGGADPQHVHSGLTDIVVLKLNDSGEYQWHTFYGSESHDNRRYDSGSGIALDSAGNVYITGGSYATWDGPNNEPPLHAHSGGGYYIAVLKL
ncbi:MAG: SBBP repeat-containing protein [Thermodesulfobacteriota bacterium]